MRFLIISLITIIFFFSVVGSCAAKARPLEWPLPGMGGTTDLPNYVKAIFDLIMGAVAGLAGIALIVGFIRYLTSAGSPERIGEAKKTIFSAIAGLVLLLSSVIIIRIINTDLEQLGVQTITPITINGVYLTGADQRVPCPVSVFDVKELDVGLTNLLIDCPVGKDWTFIFTKYPEIGLEGQSTTTVLRCGGNAGIGSDGSFKIQRKWPGVYLYRDPGCSDMSNATRFTGSIRILSEHNKNTVKCLEIFNEPDMQYGFILFKNPEFKSEWDDWGGGACYLTIGANPYSIGLENYSSIAIFQINPDPVSAGTEVVFYSKAHYQGVSKTIKNTDMRSTNWWSAKNIEFGYTDPQEWDRCKSSDTGWKGVFWHEDCAGSVRIAGKYIVLLRSWNNDYVTDDNYYCQLFAWKNPEGSAPPPGMEDVSNASNLKGEYLIGEGEDGVHDLFIIPAVSL